MSIRLATTNDLVSITEIYNQAVRGRMATCDEDERSLSERQVWFKQFDDRYPLWVLEAEGSIAAYGGLFRYNPKSGYRYVVENTVYVHDDQQGKGFGRAMLEHVIREARRLGYRYMQAKIFAHNPTSLALHRKLGFIDEGFQKGIAVLDGKEHDVVLLALHL